MSVGIYTSKAIGTFDKVDLKIEVDKLDSMTITPPPQFNGPEGFWTPEDLFSASISSCYILS